MTNNKNCLANILKVIVTLQNNCERLDNLNNSCTRPFLGIGPTIEPFNTRLVTLYRCNNTPVTLPYQNTDGTTSTTSIFRITKANDDTIGVLLLEEDGDTYTSTNTYSTINLNCICAIQCLGDTTVLNI